MQVPVEFDYERAASVSDAIALLTRHGPESRLVAGGHSLIPMMKLRLANPDTLIDINDLTELTGVDHRGDHAAHRRDGPARRAAALGGRRRALPDPARRRARDRRPGGPQPGHGRRVGVPGRPVRGPVRRVGRAAGRGGDRGPDRERSRPRVVPVREFHQGPYQTCIGDAEILVEVRVPIRPGQSSAYTKVKRRVGDWAVAGVGVALRLDGGDGHRGRHRAHGRRRGALRRRRGRGVPARRAGDGRGVRRGGPDRGRAQQPDGGPARPRRLQAPPGRRARRPGAAQRRRRARVRGPRRRADVQITVTVNGVAQTRDVEPRLLLVHFLRDELGLTGTHWCVRHLQLRRVRRAVRRPAGQVVHGARRDGAGPRGPHRRGARQQRRARPRPAGVQRLSRPAVRVLHARDDDDRSRPARREPGPVGPRDPRGDLRSDLPVHRLREHRPLGPRGRPGRARRARSACRGQELGTA